MVFAILTMFSGQIVGMSVGVAEGPIETWIEHTIAAHPDNPDLIKKSPKEVEKKAFRYILRGHFHGTGIGAMSVALILALGVSWVSARWKTILSLGVGVGGFLYPLCWLGSGLLMPSMGKAAAKGAVEWLVFPSIAAQFTCMCVILWIWWASFRSADGIPDGYDALKR
jgi:hypothetical protein